MMRFTVRQLSTLGTVLLILILAVFFFSPPGRRFAVAFFRPFTAGAELAGTRLAPSESPAELSRQRDELRGRLALAELLAGEAEELRLENSQLRSALQLRARPGWRLVTAGVLTRDPLQWTLRLTLDKGFSEGVREGAVVLCDGKVCGRVASVGKHSAVVETLASPACRLSVTIGELHHNGLLQGMGIGSGAICCQVDFLPMDVTLEAGMPVVTSSLGEAIPAGLPVGTVAAFPDGDAEQVIDQARKRLQIRPAADLNRVRVVSVVCRQ